jgi:hypothetical protein
MFNEITQGKQAYIRHFMETCRGLDKMMMLDESENKPHSLYIHSYIQSHILLQVRGRLNVALSFTSCITRIVILRSLLLITFTAYTAK